MPSLPQVLLLVALSPVEWLVAAQGKDFSGAFEIVAPDTTNADVDYFEFETAQLTPQVIANLASEGAVDVSPFDFAVPGESSTQKGIPRPRCKAYPGTPEWPSDLVWKQFDTLLGGRLVKTVPLAAPCFNSWPQVKDEARCAVVKSRWGTPRFQYAPLSPNCLTGTRLPVAVWMTRLA